MRKEKLLLEFVTAETSTFDWQASALSGQTEPISLISPMVFSDFVSTWLGFVSKDFCFSLLFKDSLGLASLSLQVRQSLYVHQTGGDRCFDNPSSSAVHVVKTS